MQRKHAAKAAARSLGVGGPLDQIRIGLVDLDKVGEGFDARVGECHDVVVARAIDSDQAVLLVHFVGDVPQPVSSCPPGSVRAEPNGRATRP